MRYSVEELSQLKTRELLAYLRKEYPGYTPRQLSVSRPDLCTFLQDHHLFREAIAKGVLREDYSVGWSNRALLSHVQQQYTGSAAKELCKSHPELMRELKERSLLPALLDEHTLLGVRSPGHYKHFTPQQLIARVKKQHRGSSLSELKCSDKLLYGALGNELRAQLLKKGILIVRGIGHQKQRYQKKQRHRKRKYMPTISLLTPEDPNPYVLPQRVEIPHTFYPPREKTPDAEEHARNHFTQRLEWAAQEGLFGEDA